MRMRKIWIEPPSPVYRRRRLRRSRRNVDEDEDEDERPRTRSRSTRSGRILRTRNSTVRIIDSSSSSSSEESPDDTDENEENGVNGRLRPLQRRRYDVDNVRSVRAREYSFCHF